MASGNVAVALLAHTMAIGAGLIALILTFGPISGAHHTLVIDANGWGQIVQGTTTRATDIATWFTNAAAPLRVDPLHNILFSVHMYEFYTSLANINDVLAHQGAGTTRGVDLPLMTGEFGISHGMTATDQIAVDWQDLIAQCTQRGIGYIAWSWYGNVTPDVLPLNMAQGWEGPLTGWGADVLTLGPNSIMSSSRRASIFP